MKCKCVNPNGFRCAGLRYVLCAILHYNSPLFYNIYVPTTYFQQCSVTCGVGYQTRQLLCRQKISQSLTVDKEADECRRFKGDNELRKKRCKKRECRAGNRRKSKYLVKNIVQFSHKRHVKLSAGDKGTFLLSTSISIHCHLVEKTHTRWFFNKKIITKKSRMRGRHSEILLIKKGSNEMSGVYKCAQKARRKQSVVKFYSINEAEKRMYQLRINLKESNLPFQLPSHTDLDLSGLHTTRPILRKELATLLSKQGLNLQYTVSEWSECSVSCGGGGSRSRKISCGVLLADAVVTFDTKLCARKKMKMPIESADCLFKDCPTWQTGAWSKVCVCV